MQRYRKILVLADICKQRLVCLFKSPTIIQSELNNCSVIRFWLEADEICSRQKCPLLAERRQQASFDVSTDSPGQALYFTLLADL